MYGNIFNFLETAFVFWLLFMFLHFFMRSEILKFMYNYLNDFFIYLSVLCHFRTLAIMALQNFRSFVKLSKFCLYLSINLSCHPFTQLLFFLRSICLMNIKFSMLSFFTVYSRNFNYLLSLSDVLYKSPFYSHFLSDFFRT